MFTVSQLYHKMFRCVWGTKPRKFPLTMLCLNLADLLPRGRIHTLHPNVQNPEKIFLSGSLKDSRGILSIHGHGIWDLDVMKEGIWPELDIESSTNKKGSNMITDSLMSVFNRNILVRWISTSRVNFIVMISKDVEDVRISPKLSTLVKKDMLVSTNRTVD